MVSLLFHQVRARQAAARLGQALGARFDARPLERIGTILTANSINVSGQQYELTGGEDLPAGAQIEVRNIQRPAAAVYAPRESGSIVIVGGGGATGGGNNGNPMVRHDIIGTYHTVNGPPGWVVGISGARRLALLDPAAWFRLWLGREGGLRLGMWQNPDGRYVMGFLDTAGVPVFQVSEFDGEPGTLELTIGYGDQPHIYLAPATTTEFEEHRRLVVQLAALAGSDTAAANTVPTADGAGGVSWQIGSGGSAGREPLVCDDEILWCDHDLLAIGVS